LRWFDYWLKGVENGIMREPRVHYYTVGAQPGNEWRATDRWPPPARPTAFYLVEGISGTVHSCNDGGLWDGKSSPAAGIDSCAIDYSASSGVSTRWTNDYRRTTGYMDLRDNDAKGLTYTSAPLSADVEITGHPVVDLWVHSSQDDADLFAYLEDVDAQGWSHYVTEGVLRASLRAETS